MSSDNIAAWYTFYHAHFSCSFLFYNFIHGISFLILALSLTFNTTNAWCILVFLLTVFVYDPKVDSVLRVTKEDYKTCNKAKPIEKYNEGMTKFQLNQSGPFYFIGGSKGKCSESGQKLIVIVLSNGEHPGTHTKHSSAIAIPAPAPSPDVAFQGNYAHGLRCGFMSILMGVGTLVGMVLLWERARSTYCERGAMYARYWRCFLRCEHFFYFIFWLCFGKDWKKRLFVCLFVCLSR